MPILCKIHRGDFIESIHVAYAVVVDEKGDYLILKALESGVLLNRKGVNFPGVELNIKPLTNQDKEHIMLAIKNNIDWLALSFVRQSSDIIINKGKCNDSTSIPCLIPNL